MLFPLMVPGIIPGIVSLGPNLHRTSRNANFVCKGGQPGQVLLFAGVGEGYFRTDPSFCPSQRLHAETATYIGTKDERVTS